jgi:N-acetylglutamate synthase-like GNAT family acetyltransferase
VRREMDPSVVVRPATASDHHAIITIVRDARINPLGLDWRRFLVAEDHGQVIGTGQIKPHGDGSRELASITVLAERQRQGIASAITRALLNKVPGTLYLTCRDHLETFYAQFGFRRIPGAEMTPYFKRLAFLVKVLTPVARLFVGSGVQLIVMKREDVTA